MGVKKKTEQPVAVATAIACGLMPMWIAALIATGPVTRAVT
jgi:hypothetical protein